ncbi:hypothetical protein MNEG_4068, partial [Monoraphidium neglectum]
MPPLRTPQGVWRFKSASSDAVVEADKLFSLNDFQGRQTWEFEEGGDPAELEKVEELRAAFKAGRHSQKHRRAAVGGLQPVKEGPGL